MEREGKAPRQEQNKNLNYAVWLSVFVIRWAHAQCAKTAVSEEFSPA